MNSIKTYSRTLDNLPTDTVEAWVFESSESRRQAERYYDNKGKKVKLHSAYKTLLCDILEDDLLMTADTATIRYPVVAGDEPKRFRLECYPLVELTHCQLAFEPFDYLINEDNSLPYYEIITDRQTYRLDIPVRWVMKATGEKQLVSCGWVKTIGGESKALLTDFEQIYSDVCLFFENLPLQGNPPFFDTLNIAVGLPVRDSSLSIGDEHISLIEALHEDIYFSVLEILQCRLGLPQGSRKLTPGQVIPKVTFSLCPSLQMSYGQSYNHDADEIGGSPSLDVVGHWLTPKQIGEHLRRLQGTIFSATSRQGRLVQGCFIGCKEAPIKLAISGGQHANESSGVVGALRAAYALKKNSRIAFTVCPSENVDGYAAFRDLCRDNPNHMHHAARYTAAGNDLTHGCEYESLIRHEAQLYLSADVHINLHGYPSHEWTRPLSGYVPKGFSTWTIPKGFFIICRYNKGYRNKAEKILNAAIDAIAGYNAQMQQNRLMLTRYLNAVGEANFKIAHKAIPYMIDECDDTNYPIEIITEASDETVYGESFRIAHESHLRVILGISEVL